MSLINRQVEGYKQASPQERLRIHIFLVGILIAGLVLRSYMAWVDPFLHPWDERYHALVARNMMQYPFKPMLTVTPYNTYDPNMWCCNHIWLHKQPLFMWQMALSMKVFGVSEFTMRLPSVIMGTLMILLLYRIVLLFTHNAKIALIAAGLLAFSNFHLQMISGVKGMDHNDVALGFYVLASIWAYSEYNRNGKWYWIVLIGVFSGCAILNKWLLGLLVFAGWGVNILLHFRKGRPLREIGHFVVSLVVCCIVFVPWQLYILNRFPNEANYEFAFNKRHITEALEGHQGSVFFYLKHLPEIFGKYIFILIPVGGIIALIKGNISRKLMTAFLIEIVIVFVFFSFIVKTKVDTYFFFVVPLCLAFLSIAIYYICLRIKKIYLIVPFLTSITFLVLNPIAIMNYLSSENTDRMVRIHNASIYRSLDEELPDSVKIVMNMNSFENVDVMFYNSKITAYHWTLPENDLIKLKERKIPIAIFQPYGNHNIPSEVSSYPFLYIIQKPLKEI